MEELVLEDDLESLPLLLLLPLLSELPELESEFLDDEESPDLLQQDLIRWQLMYV